MESWLILLEGGKKGERSWDTWFPRRTNLKEWFVVKEIMFTEQILKCWNSFFSVYVWCLWSGKEKGNVNKISKVGVFQFYINYWNFKNAVLLL